MQNINLIYIDDMIDPIISKYLSSYKHPDVNIKYDELKFELNNGYESLINNSLVRAANVILIDSTLFQNSTAVNGKYTGEQFKLILRKIFPYIEVIVITQNEITGEFSSTIPKYNPRDARSSEDYYNDLLPNRIGLAIKSICEYRDIITEIKPNMNTSILIEKINNSLDGIDAYDELKKADIDAIVEAFKKLQENLNE